MRYEKGRRDATRTRILETASRRFRQDGAAASGIAGIMAEAGLTNGAFYLHFASKAELMADAVIASMDRQREAIALAPPDRAGFEAMVRAYLSASHRDDPGDGCPSAALLPEIGRADPGLRRRYSAALEALAMTIAQKLPGGEDGGRGRALALLGLLAGTLQLARAVDDEAFSDEVLESGVRAAMGFWPRSCARTTA